MGKDSKGWRKVEDSGQGLLRAVEGNRLDRTVRNIAGSLANFQSTMKTGSPVTGAVWNLGVLGVMKISLATKWGYHEVRFRQCATGAHTITGDVLTPAHAYCITSENKPSSEPTVLTATVVVWLSQQ